MIEIEPIQKMGCEKSGNNSFFTSLLKEGSTKKTANMEKRKAITASMIDSKKNCVTNCFLSEPSVFRTPTSLALFSERAVERFIKLTQAIIKITKAMIPNNRTYLIIPPTFLPSLKSLNKRHLLIGNPK